MSTLIPVSFAASLAFCPFLPIASESCDGSTITLVVVPSSKSSTLFTFAGLKTADTNSSIDSFHSTISIFSPFNSSTIFFILRPFCPIQAPTVSMFLSAEYTAIFALEPASLATDFISINPSAISGISSSNNFS